MATEKSQLKRIEIPYFEGINTLVSHGISKKQELEFAINARSEMIGTIEKRKGYRRLGSEITSVGNYGIFHFNNDTATNKNFFRITKVGATVSIYYMITAPVDGTWTALTGNGTSLTAANFSHTIAENSCFLVNGNDANRYIDANGTNVYTSADIGASDTQFDITNPAGNTFRYTYDTTGTNPNITYNIKLGDVIHLMAQNFAAANKGSFVVTGVDTNYFEITNAGGAAENNKTIGTGAIRVNNHLTSSPIAYKINYYKDRLYLGDYTNTTRYKTGIMMSSVPLGIAALVDGDHDQPMTALKVTDLKYIKTNDVLDVYRGNTNIGTIIVTAKDSTTNTLTIDTFATDIKSSDELWIAGTYTGKKIFRWADNPESGIDVKQYDTFKLTGGDNDEINMFTNIGDVMMISNKNNIAVWDNYKLINYDLGIGCVSRQGYVKNLGTLFFIDYSGIFATTGGLPKLMSSKVQKYFDGATKAGLEAGAMGKKGTSIFVHIGDVALYNPDGSIVLPGTVNSEGAVVTATLANVVLEYDIRTQNWYVHTGIDADFMATYKATDDADRLEFCGTTGHVYEFLRGTKDNNTDEIPFRIDTSPITLAKDFKVICYPKNIPIEVERGSDITCFVSLDMEPFYELKGSAVKGCTVFKVTPRNEGDDYARCRNIRISLREYSTRLCKLGRMAIEFVETLEFEDIKENYN